ncbi:PepSY-associated TM helix domain-containing protein [Olivibacter jilunii]|uniref:PepSY-associated TM helix domain-containing protein n=1 Tax=Olivibacter jilunii TaxID=985016 RepID=UPI003F16F7E1
MSIKNRLLRWVFRMHGVTGLITGIFLILLGLSGSALVFMEELDHYTNKHLFQVKETAAKMSLDTIYHRITAQYPRLSGIAWLNPQAAPTEAYNYRLYLNDGKIHTYDLAVLTIDPYTGRIIREGRYDQWQSGFMQWLFQFHFSFHFGMPGTLLTAVLGITMLISILTGVLIYRKQVWKVLCFKKPIRWHNRRMLSSDLHRIVGIWSLLFNAVIFFTGFWLNLFAFDSSAWHSKMQVNPPNRADVLSIDSLYKKASHALPQLKVHSVYMPTQPGRGFAIRGSLPGDNPFFGQASSVTLDVKSGAVEAIKESDKLDFSEKLRTLVLPLHAGSFGGLPVRILYVFIGLTPGLLSITGFLLYLKRTNKQRHLRKPTVHTFNRTY